MSRPLTGSRPSLCQARLMDSQYPWMSPTVKRSPSALKLVSSTTATPIRILLSVTPLTLAPEAAADEAAATADVTAVVAVGPAASGDEPVAPADVEPASAGPPWAAVAVAVGVAAAPASVPPPVVGALLTTTLPASCFGISRAES